MSLLFLKTWRKEKYAKEESLSCANRGGFLVKSE